MPGYCEPCPGKTRANLPMGVSPSGSSGGLFERDDFPPLVSAAVGAGMVGQLWLMAFWTRGCQDRPQKIVGPSHVPSGLGMSFYWIWHDLRLLFLSLSFLIKS